MRLPTRLVPLGTAAVMAVLVSAVLAKDPQPPAAATTAPIPPTAPPAQPVPSPQAATPATPAPAATRNAPAPTAKLSGDQLEQLVAPIALYPDQLLGQILMASTYPAEVIEAARWVRVPAHRRLKGEALAAALKAKGWDPSVMALVPFRHLLKVMNDRLDWLRNLGTAFVAQQAEVMAAVQHLRQLAMAAGVLKTTPQCHCVVSTKGKTITIATVTSEPVCVPVYNTRVVYGTWPYPAYPPVVFPVPVRVASLPGFYIGFYPPVDVTWYWPLWGWNSLDWAAGSIIVDPARYAVLSTGDPGFAGRAWVHNPGRWGAVSAAPIGMGAAANAAMAGALPGMSAARRHAATLGGPGYSSPAAAGLPSGRAGSPGAGADHGVAAMHAARGGNLRAHGRRASHRPGAYGRGRFAGRAHVHRGRHGPQRGGHFTGPGRFAGHGGGHFGGPHFAMGGGPHGGRGHGGHGGGHFGGPHFAMGGGPHGGGGRGHGGYGHGH